VRLAISGTPGCGKTLCAKHLARRGYTTASLEDILRKKGIGKKDRSGCLVVDPRSLRVLEVDAEIVEGHLSHFLPVECVVILRCHPRTLEKRLKKKGYDKAKIRENLEAEALDVIVIETLQEGKTPYQIDTTMMTPEGVADSVEKIIKGKGNGFRTHIDFSEAVLEWY
jgi:adenylate kinase